MRNTNFSIREILAMFVILGLGLALVLEVSRRMDLQQHSTAIERELGYIRPSNENVLYIRQLVESEKNAWTFRIQIPSNRTYELYCVMEKDFWLFPSGGATVTGQFEITVRVSERLKMHRVAEYELEVIVAQDGSLSPLKTMRFPAEQLGDLVGSDGIKNLTRFADSISDQSTITEFQDDEVIELLKLGIARPKVVTGRYNFFLIGLRPPNKRTTKWYDNRNSFQE